VHDDDDRGGEVGWQDADELSQRFDAARGSADDDRVKAVRSVVSEQVDLRFPTRPILRLKR
jgi:hypothetical protein